VLVAPTGPDPVLAGIRGDSPQTVLEAFRRVKVGEEPLGYLIYGTNQRTDAHPSGAALDTSQGILSWLARGHSCHVKAIPGGHLRIELRTDDFSNVSCMVYEPSGDLKRVARHLMPRDSVRVSGGVRKASPKSPAVVNIERIAVLAASRVRPGTYVPSPRAQRHLTKRLIRYGREHPRPYALIAAWVATNSSL
jgi:tRNA(Ile2)-agmatinylcytidine synthase